MKTKTGSIKTVEIFFADLSEEKQQEILETTGYRTESEGNFEICPIAVVDFEGEPS